MDEVRITWVKSSIGYKQDQKDTIRALGFHRLNESIVKDDTPTIRGMIHKVRHLVRAEPVAGEEVAS